MTKANKRDTEDGTRGATPGRHMDRDNSKVPPTQAGGDIPGPGARSGQAPRPPAADEEANDAPRESPPTTGERSGFATDRAGGSTGSGRDSGGAG